MNTGKRTFLATTIVFLAFSISNSAFSQNSGKDTSDYPYWIEMMQDPSANFFETQKAFEMYWDGRERDKGDGWKVFKRWEYWTSLKVDEYGNKPKAGQLISEFNKMQNTSKSVLLDDGHWEEIGPITLPSNGTGQPNGMGRLNAIGFHPTNVNTYYVGSPAGGLWKTENGGNAWECLTDTLPTLGASAIVVDYSNANTVYIGTGDRDAGDSPGYGVWKSTDAGDTWSPSNTGMGNRTVGKMIQNPKDSMTLLAATSGGVYKTTDGGQTWTRKSSSANFKDIAFKPTDTSIVYATEGGDFYRSTDGGETWTQGATGLPSASRMVIGVSPGNGNYVYVLEANSRTYKGMYRSTNSGQSFTLMSSTPNILDYSCQGSGTSGQAWYDLAIAVDRSNANTVYVGGINIWKSTNGGSSWSCVAHWVGGSWNCNTPSVHADQHEFAINPLNNNLYACHDGGLHISGNGGSSWTDKSDGLAIAQVYKIGQSAQSRNLVINGYQDNGTAIYDGSWRTEIGGDGMECIIDPVDSNYMYGALYYGDIRRSTNYGVNFSGITSYIRNTANENGEWITPYLLRETNSNTMFAGFRNVWKSTNVRTATSSSGVSWTKISNNLGGSNFYGLRVLENSPANDNILYVAREDGDFFRSDNINATTPTYTDLTSSRPTSTWPRDIEAHPFSADSVYVVQSRKVFVSGDKGSTWTDITGTGIPNVNINCIVFDSSTTGDLYIGTELGVFYRKAGNTAWTDFGGGMPDAIDVTELEIYYDQDREKSRITAATYGRGMWTSPLYTTPASDFSASSVRVCKGQSIQFSDESTGFYTSVLWSFPGGNPTSSTDENPSVSYSNPGTYNVSLRVTNMLETKITTKTAYIEVDSSTVIDVTPVTATINQGDTITLNVTGGTMNPNQYYWYQSPNNNKLSSSKGVSVQAYPDVTTTFTVEHTNLDCGDTASASSEITVIPTGINEGNFEGGQIKIYPNPVSDVMKVRFDGVEKGEKQIRILDAGGKLMHAETVIVNDDVINFNHDISSYSNGYYLIQVIGSRDALVFKLLVDH